METKEEKSPKEERIRALTKLYYSNPKIQEVLLKFAQNREVVPRYYEGFGKRPDAIQYISDIMGLVNKGATSFHASEEIWNDPLKISTDLSIHEFNELRRGWDLLIDIDSPFLDCSRIAARLIIAALEHHGITKYGIKFSGSKGFHIIVSSKAFPKEYEGRKTKEMFPEWPRAISEYLMHYIRKDYNNQAGEILTNFDAIKERTKLTKEELMEVYCKVSGRPAKKGVLTKFVCPVCGMEVERRDAKITKRRLRCLNNSCAGVLDVAESLEYFYCEYTKDPDNDKMFLSSDRHPEAFESVKSVSAEKVAALDLVLVAPRHLFRMPYSLHEKTSLASVVLTKEELENFSPGDANAMRVKIREFYPDNEEGEAKRLLSSAIEWKKLRKKDEEKKEENIKPNKEFKEVDFTGLEEKDFPAPIKKLLKNGLGDGRKRGLFILITFLKAVGFPREYIDKRVREWNALSEVPLKEGYIKSQIDWLFKQKRKILPPNYDNANYKDLGLIDKAQDVKNPLVDAAKSMRKKGKQ